MKKNAFRALVVALLAAAWPASIVFAVCVGSASLSMGDALRLITGRVPFLSGLVPAQLAGSVYERIVWQVRLPRVLLASLTGGILACVGGAFQSLFRNPLADPHILGVSSGAALGATVAMTLGLTGALGGLSALSGCAFVGALVAVLFVCLVARFGGQTPVSMLLTGTAVSAMLSGVISLLMTFHQEDLGKVYMWTMGSFSGANWSKVGLAAAAALVGGAALTALSGALNVLLAGEEEARTLGVPVGAVRGWTVLFSTLMVAVAVSVSGVIGFVGLIVPHCVRLLLGPDNRRLLPCAFLLGGVFLVLCDAIARTVAAPADIPVGIVTSVLGAPYFIALMLLGRRNGGELR